MGPLLHKLEDSCADCPIQRQQKPTLCTYFSVYVYMGTVKVSCGWESMSSQLTSHRQVICCRFIWASVSGSVTFKFFYFSDQWGTICHPSPCWKGNIFSLEFSRYSWCQGIALSFISAFSGYLYHLFGCILDFVCRDVLSRNVGRCVLVHCACRHAEAVLWFVFTRARLIYDSFCLKNTCLNSVKD